MARLDAFWVQSSEGTSDVESPIATLSDIFLVAQLLHQFVACLSILSKTETALLWSLAEAVVWKRWDYNIECWVSDTALGEQWEELDGFEE